MNEIERVRKNNRASINRSKREDADNTKDSMKAEQKATKNGYKVGDKVFNKKQGIVNTIVKTAKESIENSKAMTAILMTINSINE